MDGLRCARRLAVASLSVLLSVAGAFEKLASQPVIITTISAAPNPVPLGARLVLTSKPAVFPFNAATAVILSPVGNGSPLFLCGLGGLTTCTSGLNAGTLSIPIPTAPTGSPLLGRWNLSAMNLVTNATARLPGSIQFVPANFVAPSAPSSAPFVSGINPLCVWPWPVTVTFGVDGHDFDPNGAQVVVSYIYFVDHHGKFRTDWHGKDSRVAAIMLQRSPTHLLFTVDLAQIHQTAADHFGTFAGNYYVQVQNPNGKLSDGPMFFTVRPYHGPGMTHC